ncbi:4-hydroxythreonine-4-phosphate dehydrogenase PdxA [Pontibacter sp. G13]|uniref:4-hydroxythreonine-4-phosphate dehydrogenase PdxA n=1 Tax=Pontibacter sp. G13 TaxID=3074898 RepID=UPI00288B7619|nr:4-hydroxythreonine-4-phosphate dehydrogenase PdxA [Pontibacter sp. G13]WNJ21262.1 4-hydroxythreonine-4-phosphate dehydrogenase PdxA [Pontibacter sp. G13]
MSNRNHNLLRIGITLGDVNGIGPELVIKTFLDGRISNQFIPILYGSSRVLNIYRKVIKINKFHYNVIQSADQAVPGKLNVIECVPDLERVDIGKPSEIGGKAAVQALHKAIEDAQHQKLDGLVTLPVNKAVVQQFEADFTGHTEMLAKAFNVPENLMLMVSEELKVGMVTNHVPVKDISANLTVNRIVTKGMLLHESMIKDFSLQKPMIAVLGLNPHAGDNGLIGTEEQDIITEAVQKLQEAGVNAMGPYPADGYFGSLTYRKFDATLAMYHDQGLIPFKLMSGYTGVNFTAGIPFVRTSPDHGVAYDIAGKGTAHTESVRQAIYLAMDVFRNRSMNAELTENVLPTTEKGTTEK